MYIMRAQTAGSLRTSTRPRSTHDLRYRVDAHTEEEEKGGEEEEEKEEEGEDEEKEEDEEEE